MVALFELPNLHAMLIRVPGVLFALTIHEFAHGYVAYLCGDDTARLNGRLTFNPVAHLDPIGTLCMIFARFGWAKPVPVNPFNLRNRRRDDIFVSLAGVTANFATAVAVAMILRLVLKLGFNPITATRPTLIAWKMAQELCLVSIGLMLFNLIPLPPLDGSHVLRELLPEGAARAYIRIAPYAPIILIAMVFTGAIRFVLFWPFFYIVDLLLGDVLILTL